MPQVLPPTKQILQAAERYNCQLPLTRVDKCQYKYCQKNTHNEVQEPQDAHLEQLDKYWSEFLKAQEKSNANYFCRIKTYGNAQDPTLVKKEPVPVEEINQRILHMPALAGLLKTELFYLLSFLLNIVRLPVHRQREYMEYFLHRKLLDMEIINYFQMLSRHPNAGLTEDQLKDFQQILQHIMDMDTSTDYISYYNPEHIFMKSFNDINPYELEYLNMILHSNHKLTIRQTLYLAKFVHKLQELDETTREAYLGFLREKNIMPFNTFDYLILYLFAKAKRVDENKLKTLLGMLHALMDVGPCELPPPAEIKKPPKHFVIDHSRIDKIFRHLMRAIIPNIVLLREFKNFLNSMMLLDEEQVMSVVNSLKICRTMTPLRFSFIFNFINSGKLGKVDKAKKKFIEILKKIEAAPVNTEISFQVNLPHSRGPIKQKYECVQATAAQKAVEKEKKPSSDLPTISEDLNETNKNNSSKVSKKATKSSKKKAGKKKK